MIIALSLYGAAEPLYAPISSYDDDDDGDDDTRRKWAVFHKFKHDTLFFFFFPLLCSDGLLISL